MEGKVIHCACCGKAIDLAVKRIAIEFKTLKCPDCGKNRFKIVPESIREDKKGEFLFRIRIACQNNACKMSKVITSSFRGLLGNIRRVVISVRDGKMEIERFNKSLLDVQ
jgi:predicted  nucleic acid-binding Zn-ribbon protein